MCYSFGIFSRITHDLEKMVTDSAKNVLVPLGNSRTRMAFIKPDSATLIFFHSPLLLLLYANSNSNKVNLQGNGLEMLNYICLYYSI